MLILHIDIWKVKETNDRATYLFGPKEKPVGLFIVDKSTRHMAFEAIDGQDIAPYHLKVMKVMTEHLARGEYPDTAAYML